MFLIGVNISVKSDSVSSNSLHKMYMNEIVIYEISDI